MISFYFRCFDGINIMILYGIRQSIKNTINSFEEQMGQPSDLSFFSTLVRSGTLSAAAVEFNVTPSAASKRLTRLEQQLGVRLINRTTRRLSLTHEGELYLKEGRRILAEIAELEQVISSSQAAPKGLLKVNATFGFGRNYITRAISQFSLEFPKLEIQLLLTDRPMNLADESVDIGIRFGEPPDTRVIARKIVANKRHIFASPIYFNTRRRPQSPHDLKHHNCLVLRQDDLAYGLWRFTKNQKTETIKVRGMLSSNDGETVQKWALEGRGIMMRSEWDTTRFVRSGRLEIVLEDYALPSADIHAVYLEKHHLQAKIRVFVDFLTKYFSESAPELSVIHRS